MAIAGKVMPRARGAYSSSAVYDILDIVAYNNKPWISRKPNVCGVEPSKENAETWMLLVDVDITNADTLDGHGSEYFALASDVLRLNAAPIELKFTADGWSETAPYTQNVAADNIEEGDTPTAFFIDDSETESDYKAKLKAYGYISYFYSMDGIIQAVCKYNKPDVDVTVGFKGV